MHFHCEDTPKLNKRRQNVKFGVLYDVFVFKFTMKVPLMPTIFLYSRHDQREHNICRV